MATDEVSRPIYNPPTSRYLAPLRRIDWVCSWIAYLAGNLAIFKVLEYAGKLTVVIALCAWLADCHERQQAAKRTAWSVVNAKGGGRKDGLKYLSDNHADLKGLYGAGGYFSGIELKEKDELSWSDLADANFEKATLASVKLIGSHVANTNFANANLKGADFTSAHFEPKPPNFDHADIDDAHFKGVTGLNYLGYRALSQATNWKKADFDPGVKELIECAELGDKAPQRCQLAVPEILSSGNPVDSQLFVQALIQNISCEVRNAVIELTQLNTQLGPINTFIDKWGMQITLTLSVGAQGALAEATRADVIQYYYLVSELKKLGQCRPMAAGSPNSSLLLQSDLKLKEWLFAAMFAQATGETTLPGADNAHPTVISHEVKFVVVAGDGGDPQFQLRRAGIETREASTRFSTDAPRTHDVLIMLAPAQPSKK